MGHVKGWIFHLEIIATIAIIIGGLYSIDSKIDRQSQRTDRLYEMFIDLVKENRK